MKRFLVIITAMLILIMPALSADKTSEEYLKSKKHLAVMNPAAEKIVEKAIKRALKKEAPGRYKVKFTAYTFSGLKGGVFKYLEVTGKNVTTKDEIEIPYFNIKTLTDYNRIDYTKNPIEFKSDITFDCIAHLSDETINAALKTEEYINVLRKINKKAYPLFTLNSVIVKIKNDKLYIIMEYNFPLAPKEKDRTFMVSTKLKVVNNEIKTYDVMFDNVYGNLPLHKVTNLVNLLNPLNFTVKLVDSKNCDGKIENIKIEDDIIIVSGKMYIKGDN